ncbi:MAG: hypothetical protein HGA19_23085 [Oscillochloris sp.]|nr:hypothetical protein [Oscillochloris sp.]
MQAKDPESRFYLAQFRQLLTTYFNDGELRTLCFDLAIDYDSLPAQGKADKARELVAFAGRHGRLTELLDTCRTFRPLVDWMAVVVLAAPPPPVFVTPIVHIDPLTIDDLIVTLIHVGDEYQWQLQVQNTGQHEVQSLSFVFGRPSAGLSINPARIEVARAAVGAVSLPEEIILNISSDLRAGQLPFKLSYRKIGSGSSGTHSYAFIVRVTT